MCAEIVFFSKCAKFLVGFKNSGCVSVFGTFCLVDFTLDTWCEFHQGFGYNLRNYLALGHQLDELVMNDFLKEYLQEKQGASTSVAPAGDQGHEIPVHGEVNTISGVFSRGGCTASQRKKYARDVMAVKAREPDQSPELNLFYTKVDLRDVIPHDNDPVVIIVVLVGRRVHRVLVDQGSSVDVMFWSTFNKLQLSPDQLRYYDGCLYGFAGDQVEVRGHVELRTTFTDDTASRTINISCQRPFNLQHPFRKTCPKQDRSSGLNEVYEDEAAFP